jgi:hypothetical protein
VNKSLILALAAAGSLLGAGAAHAGNGQWSVGISLPGIVLPLPPLPGLVVTGGPVYHQPVRSYRAEPVYAPEPAYYAPEPVYYAPEPVYYAPEPAYYPRQPQWRHHYRPVPVPVVSVPRYQPGWQQVGYPRQGREYGEHRGERREQRREDRREDHRDGRD